MRFHAIEVVVTKQKDPISNPHLAFGFAMYVLLVQASNFSVVGYVDP
jgi:hypothetical protein